MYIAIATGDQRTVDDDITIILRGTNISNFVGVITRFSMKILPVMYSSNRRFQSQLIDHCILVRHEGASCQQVKVNTWKLTVYPGKGLQTLSGPLEL